MAQLKSGSTVGGQNLLLKIKPSHLSDVVDPGNLNWYLGVNANGDIAFLDPSVVLPYEHAAMSDQGYSFFAGGFNGYWTGGRTGTLQTSIGKCPLSTPVGTIPSVGDLVYASENAGTSPGSHSETHGYVIGGWNDYRDPVKTDGTYMVQSAQSYNFAGTVTASQVGQMHYRSAGNVGLSSWTKVYSIGGWGTAGPVGYYNNWFGVYVKDVETFPTSAPFVTSVEKGQLVPSTEYAYYCGANASELHGYRLGGNYEEPDGKYNYNGINRFPFYTPWANSDDVGNLAAPRGDATGLNSYDYGYTVGGSNYAGTYYTDISIFPFAAPFSTVSSIGTATVNKYPLDPSLTGFSDAAGASSETYGYIAGSFYMYPNLSPYYPLMSPTPYYLGRWPVTDIERFPFAAPAVSSSYIGDMDVRASGRTSSGY